MLLLATIVHYAFGVFALGLLTYVVCSWIDLASARRLRLWLARWYEPFLAPLRRAIPAPMIGHSAVDLSPLLLYIMVVILKRLILSLLLPPF